MCTGDGLGWLFIFFFFCGIPLRLTSQLEEKGTRGRVGFGYLLWLVSNVIYAISMLFLCYCVFDDSDLLDYSWFVTWSTDYFDSSMSVVSGRSRGSRLV